ncbi:MAG: GTP cyclohydrolase II, partial [Kingella sp. (in: b-proteobacteria)]
RIAERVPLVVGVNPENQGYLHTKAEKLNHLIQD